MLLSGRLLLKVALLESELHSATDGGHQERLTHSQARLFATGASSSGDTKGIKRRAECLTLCFNNMLCHGK